MADEYKMITTKDVIVSTESWVKVGSSLIERKFHVDDKRYLMSIMESGSSRFADKYVLVITLDESPIDLPINFRSLRDAVKQAYVTVVENYNNRKGYQARLQRMVEEANAFTGGYDG